MAAEVLARGGAPVTVYEEKGEWEKPCGGGLTYKVLERYPFLLASVAPVNYVHQMEMIAPGGAVARFGLPKPVAIYARSTLNHLLAARAQAAGARMVRDRIVSLEPAGPGWRLGGRQGSYQCDYLLLATGTSSGLRRRLTSDLAPPDYLLTFGYYVPGREELLRIRFFEDFEGYAWAFPRTDHVSVGIGGRCGQCRMAELRERLHCFMAECGYPRTEAPVFSYLLPSLRACSWGSMTLAGPNWALLGDAAALVDPVTGEGIGYAMRSGELAAECLLAGTPEAYSGCVWDEIGRRMAKAARLLPHFYRGAALGRAIPSLIVELVARADRFETLMTDLVETWPFVENVGARVCRALAASMGGILLGPLREALTAAASS
jgi:flavin-dependent dehydrogenase